MEDIADFGGHIHTYERSCNPSVSGLAYVTSGGAGELYDYPVGVRANPWEVFAADVLHYCVVSVMGSKATVDAVAHSGELVDSVELTL